MHTVHTGRRRSAGALMVTLTALSLGLTACGGSSTSPSSHANAAARSAASAMRTASTTAGSTPRPVARAQGSTATTQQTAPAPGIHPRQTPPSAGAARFREALSKFAACLRQNGVNVPSPNTSGKGPVFGTKALRTNTPQFRAATAKCRTVLLGAFHAAASPHPAG